MGARVSSSADADKVDISQGVDAFGMRMCVPMWVQLERSLARAESAKAMERLLRVKENFVRVDEFTKCKVSHRPPHLARLGLPPVKTCFCKRACSNFGGVVGYRLPLDLFWNSPPTELFSSHPTKWGRNL